MNIGYGMGKGIGGITHTMFLVNKVTCKKYVYPLKDLTSSLLKALKCFLCNICTTPIRMIADFDDKLIKGKVEDYLISQRMHVSRGLSWWKHQPHPLSLV